MPRRRLVGQKLEMDALEQSIMVVPRILWAIGGYGYIQI